MKRREADEDFDQTPHLLVSWSLRTAGMGELVLGLRFLMEGDSTGDENCVHIRVPAAAALYLAEEIEKQARRGLT